MAIKLFIPLSHTKFFFPLRSSNLPPPIKMFQVSETVGFFFVWVCGQFKRRVDFQMLLIIKIIWSMFYTWWIFCCLPILFHSFFRKCSDFGISVTADKIEIYLLIFLKFISPVFLISSSICVVMIVNINIHHCHPCKYLVQNLLFFCL